MRIKLLLLLISEIIAFSCKSQGYPGNLEFYRFGYQSRYAKALGMGGNYSAYADGPEAEYYNPAGLAIQEGLMFILDSESGSYKPTLYYSNDIRKRLHAAITYSHKKAGGFSISHSYMSNIELNPTYGGFSDDTLNAFRLTYSRKVSDWLALGASMTSYKFPGNIKYKGSRKTFGLSVLARKSIAPASSISAALVIRDFTLSGRGMKEEALTFASPMVNIGGTYHVKRRDSSEKGIFAIPLQLVLTVDAKYGKFNTFSTGYPFPLQKVSGYQAGSGVQLTALQFCDLRAGYAAYQEKVDEQYPDARHLIMVGVGLNYSSEYLRKNPREQWKAGVDMSFREVNLRSSDKYAYMMFHPFHYYRITNLVTAISIKFHYKFN